MCELGVTRAYPISATCQCMDFHWAILNRKTLLPPIFWSVTDPILTVRPLVGFTQKLPFRGHQLRCCKRLGVAGIGPTEEPDQSIRLVTRQKGDEVRLPDWPRQKKPLEM